MQKTPAWGVFCALLLGTGTGAAQQLDPERASRPSEGDNAPTVVLQCAPSRPAAPAKAKRRHAPPTPWDAESDGEVDESREHDARPEREARPERGADRRDNDEVARLALKLAREMERERAERERPIAHWQQSQPKPKEKRFSRGLLATGITFMSVGGLVMITSAIGAAATTGGGDSKTVCNPSGSSDGSGSGSGYCASSWHSDPQSGWFAAMGIAGAGVMAGIAMTAVGAVKVPVVETATASVRLEASPASAGISGSF